MAAASFDKVSPNKKKSSDNKAETHRANQKKYREKNKTKIASRELVNRCIHQAKELTLNHDTAKTKFTKLCNQVIAEAMLKGIPQKITQEDLYAQISNYTMDTFCDADYHFPYTNASLALYNNLFNKTDQVGPIKLDGGVLETHLLSRSRFNRKLILYYLCMVDTYKFPRSHRNE